MLTACGIETLHQFFCFFRNWSYVATVLTACGIETDMSHLTSDLLNQIVATVLTACGIETYLVKVYHPCLHACCNSTYRLRYWNSLQRPLYSKCPAEVATVLTVYGMRRMVPAKEQSDDVASTFLTYNYISIIKRAVLSVFITEAQLFHYCL